MLTIVHAILYDFLQSFNPLLFPETKGTPKPYAQAPLRHRPYCISQNPHLFTPTFPFDAFPLSHKGAIPYTRLS